MLFSHYKKVMEVKRDRTMFNKAFGDQIKMSMASDRDTHKV